MSKQAKNLTEDKEKLVRILESSKVKYGTLQADIISKKSKIDIEKL